MYAPGPYRPRDTNSWDGIRTASFRTLLSAAQTYTYVPTVFSANLFPKFEEEVMYVDISTGSVTKVLFVQSGLHDTRRCDFRVPYGSDHHVGCAERPVPGSSTGRDSASARLLTEETSYSFTATVDCGIYALYHAAENLSAAGTANCYISPRRGRAVTDSMHTSRATAGRLAGHPPTTPARRPR